MVFSSLVFLFIFLPIVVLGYFIMPNIKFQNIWLFVMSIIFYSFIGIKFALFFLIEIIFNWVIGILLEKKRNANLEKLLILIFGLVFDIGFLMFFKFNGLLFNFMNNNFNTSFLEVMLPIGISFYTFQEMSYIVVVYRGQKCQMNIFNLGLYLAFFPQLIAGPIVRYNDI